MEQHSNGGIKFLDPEENAYGYNFMNQGCWGVDNNLMYK